MNGSFIKRILSIIEALKEGLRVVTSILIAWLLTDGVIGTIVSLYGGQLSVTERAMLVSILTPLVRSIDRYIHVNPDISSKGFLPK